MYDDENCANENVNMTAIFNSTYNSSNAEARDNCLYVKATNTSDAYSEKWSCTTEGLLEEHFATADCTGNYTEHFLNKWEHCDGPLTYNGTTLWYMLTSTGDYPDPPKTNNTTPASNNTSNDTSGSTSLIFKASIAS